MRCLSCTHYLMIVPVDTTELVQVWLFVTRMCFVWSSGRVHVGPPTSVIIVWIHRESCYCPSEFGRQFVNSHDGTFGSLHCILTFDCQFQGKQSTLSVYSILTSSWSVLYYQLCCLVLPLLSQVTCLYLPDSGSCNVMHMSISCWWQHEPFSYCFWVYHLALC